MLLPEKDQSENRFLQCCRKSISGTFMKEDLAMVVRFIRAPLKRLLYSRTWFPVGPVAEAGRPYLLLICLHAPCLMSHPQWFSSDWLWKKPRIQGHRAALVQTRPRRVRTKAAMPSPLALKAPIVQLSLCSELA